MLYFCMVVLPVVKKQTVASILNLAGIGSGNTVVFFFISPSTGSKLRQNSQDGLF